MINQKENNEEEFSLEKRNMEIEKVSDDFSLVKGGVKSKGIFIKNLNIFTDSLKKRHERHYKNSKFHLFADLFLLLVIIGLVIFIIYNTFRGPSGLVSLNISREGEIVSGKTQTFEIDYKNREKTTLGNASLALDLPRGFNLISVNPENNFNKITNTFSIGDLTGGANGKIKVTGQIFGAVPSHNFISATMNFKENGSENQVLSSLDYDIVSSDLSLNLNLPEKIYKNTDFIGSATVKNNGSADLKNVSVIFDNNWNVADSDLIKNNRADFADLKSGEEEKINFRVLNDKNASASSFQASVFLDTDEGNLKQAEVEKNFTLTNPDLNLTLQNETDAINAGDPITFKFDFKNVSSGNLSDLKFDLSSFNDNFELDKISVLNNQNNVKIDNNSLVYNGDLKPGQEDGFELKTLFLRKKIVYNDAVDLLVTTSYKTNGNDVEFNFESPDVKILSNVNVISGGYYYSPEGDQLGIGPLPPIAQIPTDYWVVWEVKNTGNDLKNLIITADLPDNVVWLDQKSLLAGDLEYGQIGKRVAWTVNNVDKAGGDYKANFEIGIVPTNGDVGKVLQLLKNVHFTVEDSFCGQEIKGVLPNIDTNLEMDKLASGKGVVQPFK